MRLRTLIIAAAVVLAIVAGTVAVGWAEGGVPTPPSTEVGR